MEPAPGPPGLGGSHRGVVPLHGDAAPEGGQGHVFISLEEDLAAISITRDRGVIGVDLAAFPHHLAGAEASPGGHLIALEAIPPTGMAG
jgi:hypothetical protein